MKVRQRFVPSHTGDHWLARLNRIKWLRVASVWRIWSRGYDFALRTQRAVFDSPCALLYFYEVFFSGGFVRKRDRPAAFRERGKLEVLLPSDMKNSGKISRFLCIFRHGQISASNLFSFSGMAKFVSPIWLFFLENCLNSYAHLPPLDDYNGCTTILRLLVPMTKSETFFMSCCGFFFWYTVQGSPA